MIPSIPIPYLPAAFTWDAASTDTRLLSALQLHTTQRLARRANPIPFSPTNRIISRIFGGNAAHRMSYDTATQPMETISKYLYQAVTFRNGFYCLLGSALKWMQHSPSES